MEKLKAFRKSHKLTQQEIAEIFGIRQSTYSDYESGHKKPRPSKAREIAKITGLSLEYLFFGDSDSRPQ